MIEKSFLLFFLSREIILPLKTSIKKAIFLQNNPFPDIIILVLKIKKRLLKIKMAVHLPRIYSPRRYPDS